MKAKHVFAVIAVAMAALSAQMVHAQPDSARIVTYYADASMGEIVGESGNGCEHGFRWGEKTAYYTIETWDCDGI